MQGINRISLASGVTYIGIGNISVRFLVRIYDIMKNFYVNQLRNQKNSGVLLTLQVNK